MRRLHAAGAALALAATLGLGIPHANKPPYDVAPHSTLAVFHKSAGPGGQQTPWIRASSHLYVLHPPQGGTVQYVLQYRRGLAATWIFAGRRGWGNPWHHGWTKAETIEYVCIYNKSWWRLVFTYDFIRYNGQGAKGTYYWPSKRGVQETCVVIEGS